MTIRDFLAKIKRMDRLDASIVHMAVECPEIVREARPGNFVLLRIGNGQGKILRRPFGIAGVNGNNVELLFRVVGEGTKELAALEEGDMVSVRGPVGGEFQTAKHPKTWAVAGTLGVVPLLFYRQVYGTFDRFLLGVPDGSWRSFVSWIEKRIPEAEIFSNSGEMGREGSCLLGLEEELMEEVSILSCGPNGMMKALWDCYGDLCDDIQVSLEKRMACGIGGCYGCVVDAVTGKRRVCVDGPVFQARDISWGELHV